MNIGKQDVEHPTGEDDVRIAILKKNIDGVLDDILERGVSLRQIAAHLSSLSDDVDVITADDLATLLRLWRDGQLPWAPELSLLACEGIEEKLCAHARAKEARRLRDADRAVQSTKPRYVVRDRAGRALLETDSKFEAWCVWFRGRRDGATAHDRRSWIEDETSWVRCGDLPPEKRAN